jgi:hypothetical protein
MKQCSVTVQGRLDPKLLDTSTAGPQTVSLSRRHSECGED